MSRALKASVVFKFDNKLENCYLEEDLKKVGVGNRGGAAVSPGYPGPSFQHFFIFQKV